jgi:hypothetical protein
MQPITIQQWNGTARDLGELWTLRKGSRVASCHLWTHPKGGEVRLTVDAEWQRGEALADAVALLDVADEWRKQFESERLGLRWLSTDDCYRNIPNGRRCNGQPGRRWRRALGTVEFYLESVGREDP